MTEYELGSIKVTAEYQENPETKIEGLRDMVAKYDFLREKMKEHCYAVFIDGGNHLIGDKLLGIGTRDTCTVDNSDLVRTASIVNAAAVILIHNHPSDKVGSTPQDQEFTRNIRKALDLIDVRLLDHVIISRNHEHSMKANQDPPF